MIFIGTLIIALCAALCASAIAERKPVASAVWAFFLVFDGVVYGGIR